MRQTVTIERLGEEASYTDLEDFQSFATDYYETFGVGVGDIVNDVLIINDCDNKIFDIIYRDWCDWVDNQQ